MDDPNAIREQQQQQSMDVMISNTDAQDGNTENVTENAIRPQLKQITSVEMQSAKEVVEVNDKLQEGVTNESNVEMKDAEKRSADLESGERMDKESLKEPPSVDVEMNEAADKLPMAHEAESENKDMMDQDSSNELPAAAANENNDSSQEPDNDKESDDPTSKRRTKRRRSSVTFSRYSPGEGGGLKRHKGDDSQVVGKTMEESQAVLKSTSDTPVEKETKKKEKKKENIKSSSLQYPIYHWTDAGTIAPSDSKILHEGLSIDFGPLGEEALGIFQNGSWKCGKCHHTNLSTKSRCSVCLSWKGGKRENYPRRGSESNNAASAPLIVRVGDDVLISSGDNPWKDLNRLASRADLLEKNGEEDEEEVSLCYDDPVSNEPGLAVLDPYVARIESMWEEEVAEKSGVSPESRMMIQTRWYFRREDMEGIQLTMNGESNVQDQIVGDMTIRDLILSDQMDLNSVSCILGKTNILCLNPESKQKVKGGFVCRYKMNLGDSDGCTGTLSPILDSDEKEARGGSDAFTGASSEDETYPSRTGACASSAYGAPLSPRRVISEGPTVGKIKVGPDHQATIPDQVGFFSLL
jgi:hypothetical protein